jgi:hypothetical protein
MRHSPSSPCTASCTEVTPNALADTIDGAMPVVHAGEVYRLNVEAGIATGIHAFETLARQPTSRGVLEIGSARQTATARQSSFTVVTGAPVPTSRHSSNGNV